MAGVASSLQVEAKPNFPDPLNFPNWVSALSGHQASQRERGTGIREGWFQTQLSSRCDQQIQNFERCAVGFWMSGQYKASCALCGCKDHNHWRDDCNSSRRIRKCKALQLISAMRSTRRHSMGKCGRTCKSLDSDLWHGTISNVHTYIDIHISNRYFYI